MRMDKMTPGKRPRDMINADPELPPDASAYIQECKLRGVLRIATSHCASASSRWQYRHCRYGASMIYAESGSVRRQRVPCSEGVHVVPPMGNLTICNLDD